MADEKILQDVIDLLKLPGIDLALHHKVEELKQLVSRNLTEYLPLIGWQSPQKKGAAFKGIEFNLIRMGKGLWIPIITENPDCDAYEVIPQAVVDHIVNHPVETGLAKMEPGLKLPELPGQVFDIIFEKCDSKFIRGNIHQRQDKSDIIYPDQRKAKNGFRDVGTDAARNDIIEALLYYLLSNDDYYHHVVSEFFYRWKPAVDSRLLTGTTAG